MKQDDAGSAPMLGSVANHSAIPNSWILVTERLPEKGSAVLGFRDADQHWGNAAYGMAWREIDDESQPGLRWNESGRPTHWMPLPAPPTDGK